MASESFPSVRAIALNKVSLAVRCILSIVSKNSFATDRVVESANDLAK